MTGAQLDFELRRLKRTFAEEIRPVLRLHETALTRSQRRKVKDLLAAKHRRQRERRSAKLRFRE